MNNSPFDKLERTFNLINRHLDKIDEMIIFLRHELKGSMESIKEETEKINKKGDRDGN